MAKKLSIFLLKMAERRKLPFLFRYAQPFPKKCSLKLQKDAYEIDDIRYKEDGKYSYAGFGYKLKVQINSYIPFLTVLSQS
jgi:hypothetical protein